MGDPTSTLSVRVSCYGHASPRWNSARNAAQADRFNQHLSELRAQNVRKAVEAILKREIPNFKLAVPATGLGSHGAGTGMIRFPPPQEPNAAFDRSVVVSVDPILEDPGVIFKPSPPRRIPTQSKVWILSVVTMIKGTGAAVVTYYVRISLENPKSGKKIYLSGLLIGGGAVVDPMNSFSLDKPDLSILKAVGHEVIFTVPTAMDFDDWYNLGRGWVVRIDKAAIKFGLTTKQTWFRFTDLPTDPNLLDFDSKLLGVGLKLDAEAYVVSGVLRMEGNNPGDYLEVWAPSDIIPTAHSGGSLSAEIVSFPTGKSHVSDLTPEDRNKLTAYVIRKARAIAIFAEYYTYIP